MRAVRLVMAVRVDHRDRSGPQGTVPWNEDGSRPAPDPREFFPGLDRPGRLDLASRYALVAAGLLPAVPADLRERTGIVLGSSTGCLAVDRDFAATLASRPQPSIYARTLPTTAGAEISRALGLRGPGLAVVQETSPGWQALVVAWQEVATGASEAMICGEYHVPPPDGTPPWVVLALLAGPSWDGPGRRLECVHLGPCEGTTAADLREIVEASRGTSPWHREVSLEGSRWRFSLGIEGS